MREGDREREEKDGNRGYERDNLQQKQSWGRGRRIGRRRQSEGRIGEGETDKEGRHLEEGKQMGQGDLGGCPFPHPKVLGKKPEA